MIISEFFQEYNLEHFLKDCYTYHLKSNIAMHIIILLLPNTLYCFVPLFILLILNLSSNGWDMPVDQSSYVKETIINYVYFLITVKI